MVDATMQAGDRPAAALRAPVRMRVASGERDARAVLAAIDPAMVYTGYQHPAMLDAWVGTAGCDPLFLVFSAAGHGPVLLPLELCANGVAGYCGGRHANGNFPVGRREDIEALGRAGEPAIKAAIRAADCPAGSIILERQHAIWEGVANPFVFGDSVESPNIALSFAIDSDFDTLLTQRGGKNKRKKIRSYRRKLDAVGPVTFHHPVAPDLVPACLDRFFALKAERFRAAGIRDVFSDAQIQAVFQRLFTANTDLYQLHALTVGDETIAIAGCTLHRGRLTVEFGTFDINHAPARPGEQLFFSMIAHACETGVEIFDFGIGDEPYKRAWCDIETRNFDTAIGLTLTGRARVAAHTGRSRAVRALKSNERAWALAKRLRKALARR